MDRLDRRRLLAAALLLASPACTAAAPDRSGPVVLAAASLQDALTEAAKRFSARGRPKPVLSFAGSAALARQIEQGAPADIFISADEAWMDYLEDRKLIVAGTRALFLTNRLVLIAPAAEPLAVSIRPGFPLARLLGGGRLSMADVNTVPAGEYGKAALSSLEVWPTVQGRIVQSDNVRAAMNFVERGEAPLGIVYATDAKASSRVMVVGAFPADSHPPIRYPLALVRGFRNPEATAFRAFLLSPEGKTVFARYGFGVS